MRYGNGKLRFVGGRLCLDFVNSADWSPNHEIVDEKLKVPEDLVQWCRAAGLLGTGRSKEGWRFEAKDLEDLKEFRRRLRRVFLTSLLDLPLRRGDLSALNETLRKPYPPRSLIARKGDFLFDRDVGLKQIIAQSAAGLLTTRRDRERVKLCPGDNCAWLFLDESRNRRRRWCSMETCGNRAKARRHYERQVGARA